MLIATVPCCAQSPSGAAAGSPSFARAHALFVSTSAQLLKDMDREKARAGYRQVVKIDDGYAPAWFNLGVLAEAASDWTEAKGDFQKYISVAPNGPYAKRAQRELGVIAQRIAHPVPTRSQEYDAAIGRARALLAASFYKESVAEAASAQKIDAARWESYAVVALCMARQKKYDEAVKFETLAVSHAPAGKREKVRAVLTQQIEKASQSKSSP